MEKLKDGWAVELRRQKEAWGAAERVKREAWLAEKTAEVKEMTIKARLGPHSAWRGHLGCGRMGHVCWMWVRCELWQGQVAYHAAGS